MCPSALSVLGLQAQGEGGSNLHQNIPWTGGDVHANFIKIGAGVRISISTPHTNRQIDNICTPIFIYRERR